MGGYPMTAGDLTALADRLLAAGRRLQDSTDRRDIYLRGELYAASTHARRAARLLTAGADDDQADEVPGQLSILGDVR
jgi:hypothetical protein